MNQDVKTMTGEETVLYLQDKLRGKKVISVEVGDTILIKECSESFDAWASPIRNVAKQQGISEDAIKEIIQEVRGSA